MNKDGSYEAQFTGGRYDGHWERFDHYVEEVVRESTRYKMTGWLPRYDVLQQVYAVYEPLRVVLPPGVSP